MPLAITLLVVLAIASVIGTVLQQNKPYADYEIKFGTFWFEIFRTLGLYDVYSALWFLLILAFLVVSTSICVVRNTPGMLRELRRFREQAQEKSLRLMKHTSSLILNQPPARVEETALQAMQAEGFRVRAHQGKDHRTLAAMKGGANKWGYWLTHIGLVIIFLGGLLDSRLPLMIGEWRGVIQPETRNIPASEVPLESRLQAGNHSFRGSVDIPEGRQANIIFLPVRDGYLVQELPYTVEVKAFRVEHYATGQPKSFESDLVIHDKDLPQPLETTISVNHPLVYKGTAIYQANFGDGGSEISMQLRPLLATYPRMDLTGNVFENYNLKGEDENWRLELTNFRLFNINPVISETGETRQRNMGPSFTFKLRNAAGEAIEYTNYMNPVMLDKRPYFISGVRKSPADPQRFLHIPADSKGSTARFFHFLANLQDNAQLRKAAEQTTRATMAVTALGGNDQVTDTVIDSMVKLTRIFINSGFDGMERDISARFPPEQVQNVTEAFTKVLRAALESVYQLTLEQEGVKTPADSDWQFYDDSLNAISNLPLYGSPWYIQMTGFQQIEASGLQITRSPGMNVVYFGSVMLTIGVFLLFYISHRRVWFYIKPLPDNQTELLLAGSANRHEREFAAYFTRLTGQLRQVLAPNKADGSVTDAATNDDHHNIEHGR
ncbi:MAG: cytochrome c biogenesis protein ResB [Thiothrix sp.]|nr:cytochrome c biogenesis protein ResB [Thiothrix sp.]